MSRYLDNADLIIRTRNARKDIIITAKDLGFTADE